jgi:hypothetical protein
MLYIMGNIASGAFVVASIIVIVAIFIGTND